MKTFRLRIGYLPFPDCLYRELSVPENVSLDSLGYAILLAFEARCNKLYSYRFGNRKVVSRIDYPLAKSLDDSYELDSECTLSSFGLEKGTHFSFFYGRGSSIQFDVLVEAVEEGESDGNIHILSGKGAGIIEDNRHILDYYLENEKDDYLYSPMIGRKVKKEDFFGLDFSNYDAKAGERRMVALFEEVQRNYREATPMLPCN